MRKLELACGVALSTLVLTGLSNNAFAAATLQCPQLAGIVFDPNIKSITSALSGSGATQFCNVNINWGRSADENINIVVGLPNNSRDGGTGGIEGRWNGRTQGIGGGGCSGNLGVTSATNAGYVGSGTDGGHSGGDCEPGVNLDGTYNVTFIDDWSRVGLKQEILLSKALANTYYGMRPLYNYWNGCSTGGRQGYLLGQELADELDGILAGAPAIYWTRFQTAQMWGQFAMKDLAGGVIPAAKQNFATARATAACDNLDGIADGIVDDPRACNYSAVADKGAICTANGGTSADPNCLTPGQAQAMDKIWDGARDKDGKKIWYHSDPGSPTTTWNGTSLFALAGTQMHWDEHDRNFDWHTATLFGAGGTKSYADIAQDGSTNQFLPGISLADETDTVGNFDAFRAKGGKVLSYVGAYDNLIMHRGVIKYYREQGARYTPSIAQAGGKGGPIDFTNVQKFYRLFRIPAAGHCGTAGVQFFPALVNWVENGVPPTSFNATIKTGIVRPICPYPQTAIYSGSGSTSDPANFTCGGNLETKQIVCKDILIKYKQESGGPLDYTNSGFTNGDCQRSDVADSHAQNGK
jgi:hypothetical protein